MPEAAPRGGMTGSGNKAEQGKRIVSFLIHWLRADTPFSPFLCGPVRDADKNNTLLVMCWMDPLPALTGPLGALRVRRRSAPSGQPEPSTPHPLDLVARNLANTAVEQLKKTKWTLGQGRCHDIEASEGRFAAPGYVPHPSSASHLLGFRFPVLARRTYENSAGSTREGARGPTALPRRVGALGEGQ
ncbi:hypothetical protein PV728_39335 [Streptomyces europaeiscabiei]|nr:MULTISPECIES: hypothetical protein [Streptomyces]MDX3636181.1 hypothetical protein [Streptomyces europaeiscabiei]MDX3654241.1 hypothetical protein [Streptomyces europaeiscabiei]